MRTSKPSHGSNRCAGKPFQAANFLYNPPFPTIYAQAKDQPICFAIGLCVEKNANPIQQRMMHLVLPLLLWLLSVPSRPVSPSSSPSPVQSQCHSCLAHCKLLPDGKPNLEQCDCERNSENTCMGEHCFSKLELFPEESLAIVQKGCVYGLPAGIVPTALIFDGCNYSGQTESVHCYCRGELCNQRSKMNNYVPAPLPTVDCCECSQPGGDEQCPLDSCLRSCRGNYCLVDFDGVDQGCGHGLPRLQNFLRIPNYLSTLQGEIACAHYQASSETAVNGCVCTEPSGMCNLRNRTWQRQMENVLTRREDDLNYCYSVSERNEKEAFSAGVYKRSTTCEGHYCFLSMSTRELVVEPDSASLDPETTNFVGASKRKYELLAGCLKVDDDKKVSLGCTMEYSLNATEPLSVHCICESHLCNYFDLLSRALNGTVGEELIAGPSSEVHRDNSFQFESERPNGAKRASPLSALSSLSVLLPTALRLLLPSFPSH